MSGTWVRVDTREIEAVRERFGRVLVVVVPEWFEMRAAQAYAKKHRRDVVVFNPGEEGGA